MRHRLAALAAVLLVGLPAGLGASPPAAAPPFPLWPIPREARVADTRLLLADATIVVPPGDLRAQYPGRLLAELVADHFGVAIPVAVTNTRLMPGVAHVRRAVSWLIWSVCVMIAWSSPVQV